MLNLIDKKSESLGLGLNSKKAVTMVISEKADTPTCNINLNNHLLEQMRSFKYLGMYIHAVMGDLCMKSKSELDKQKKAFMNLSKILTNRSISFKIRKRILDCYIELIMTYGREAGTNNKATYNIIKRSVPSKKNAKNSIH